MGFTPYLVHLGILVGIYALLTISLNLTMGYTGLLNLGHVAFFGIGAYGSAIAAMHGVPIVFSILIGITVAGLSGFLLGIPTNRIKGDYLALATLGFTFIMGSIARNWTGLTRGALGIPGIPKILPDNNAILLLFLVLVVIVTFFLYKLVNSRLGKGMQAVRDDEIAAATIGKNVFKHKLIAMAISASIAGLAGALYAHYITFIDPSIFGIQDLILLIAMVIVGGLASLKGSLVGAAIILLLPEPLRFIGFPSSLIGPARAMIFALILLLIILYRPRGLYGEVDLE